MGKRPGRGVPLPCRLALVTLVRIENWDDMERFLQQSLVIEWGYGYNQQTWDINIIYIYNGIMVYFFGGVLDFQVDYGKLIST